ncbi:hypothetical protein F1728_10695 [Gimesia benthica]|uniref:Uncharacterized protein n=1 Tax=Gimesia benthica TaxID=2608982 RepID=A0A6I6ADQ4_9PLAN|nr:hypothetical protein [Gimesia benthica]QGQ23109.1 hypothetical protein F1728_10695 [Gimesia benthica]
MQRMNPWMILVTTVFFSIAVYFSQGDGGLNAVGLLVLFNLVTLHLVQLQKENDELRTRLEALEGPAPATDLPENRAVAHG